MTVWFKGGLEQNKEKSESLPSKCALTNYYLRRIELLVVHICYNYKSDLRRISICPRHYRGGTGLLLTEADRAKKIASESPQVD